MYLDLEYRTCIINPALISRTELSLSASVFLFRALLSCLATHAPASHLTPLTTAIILESKHSFTHALASCATKVSPYLWKLEQKLTLKILKFCHLTCRYEARHFWPWCMMSLPTAQSSEHTSHFPIFHLTWSGDTSVFSGDKNWYFNPGFDPSICTY